MTEVFAPCPKCRSTEAERVKFAWWGGMLGPKLLKHVKCRACGHAYNGKSGKDNTAGIAIYLGVSAVIVFALMVIVVAVFVMVQMSR